MALDFSNLSPQELLAAESAVLTMRSLMDAAKAAPVGKGMETVEAALHRAGIRAPSVDATDGSGVPRRGAKKGAASLSCPCGRRARFKRLGDKTVLSSVGHLAVGRRYYACGCCGAKAVPWDVWAGVDQKHKVTPHARRMLVLAGSGCSFDEAERNLAELCHLQVSNDLVRAVCDEEGGLVQKWMNQVGEGDAPAKTFAEAEGAVEFGTDGIKINTTGGWREMRQSVISKREPALPAAAGQWDRRVLEPPAVRLAVCQIAHCDRIGASWERLLKAAGLPKDQNLSVIADGAKWIWDQAAKTVQGKRRAVGGRRVPRHALPLRRGQHPGQGSGQSMGGPAGDGTGRNGRPQVHRAPDRKRPAGFVGGDRDGVGKAAGLSDR